MCCAMDWQLVIIVVVREEEGEEEEEDDDDDDDEWMNDIEMPTEIKKCIMRGWSTLK